MATTPIPTIALPPQRATTTPSTRHHAPDHLAALITNSKSLHHLQQLHAALLRHGHESHPILNFKLQKSYSNFNRLDLSKTLFDSSPLSPTVYSYTDLIHSHSSKSLHEEAIELYVEMLENGVVPNGYTLSAVLKSCDLDHVLMVHSQAVRLGLGDDSFVRTGLVEVYARGGDVGSARKVFEGMGERGLVAETAMMACLAKSGDVEAARGVFEGMRERDVVCWNVMIDGYVQNGMPGEGAGLFRRMLREKVRPGEVTVVAVLSGCGQLGALQLGRWVHAYVVNGGIGMNLRVKTALVDMYSKCGSLEDAMAVFDSIEDKDVVAWNAMIAGFGLHGFGDKALELFEEMRKAGIRPTDITFIGVLNGCANAGLVSQGKELFHQMNDVYGIKPKAEHYGCMVNLLGRARQVHEAYELVKNMDVEPNVILWVTLLGACKLHKDVKLAEEIAEFLVSRNHTDAGTYVLLSNIYAAAGNWDGVKKVRSFMRGSGIQKEPGCSSVEVNNKVHEFIAGDRSHPMSKEIYMMLEEIGGWLQVHGYSPRSDTVLHDIEEEREKQRSLELHSERLAIAFGLISTKPGTTIKIMKNLRVCSECHEVTKLISKTTRRRIIVRDRSRFHHFVNGSCSCGDYW